MKRILGLLVAAVAACGIIGGVANAQSRSGNFDFYVLALSWSPSFCALEGREKGREQCDGPAKGFNYTMASVATSDALIAREPEAAAAAVRAIVATQKALKADVKLATEVGRRLFPEAAAELIAKLIERDLPYYDPVISREFVQGMNQFSRDVGILKTDVAYEDVVATGSSQFWTS